MIHHHHHRHHHRHHHHHHHHQQLTLLSFPKFIGGAERGGLLWASSSSTQLMTHCIIHSSTLYTMCYTLYTGPSPTQLMTQRHIAPETFPLEKYVAFKTLTFLEFSQKSNFFSVMKCHLQIILCDFFRRGWWNSNCSTFPQNLLFVDLQRNKYEALKPKRSTVK